MKTIAFFNSRSGVGKTMLAYHIAWMFHHLGLRVLVVDLDPQAHLTEAFLSDDQLESLWSASTPQTIMGAVGPLYMALGVTSTPHVEDVEGIGLIPGDLDLARFANRRVFLNINLPHDVNALSVHSTFPRLVKDAATAYGAEVAILDTGPNFSGINQAALSAADATVIPLAPDTPSVLALRSIGEVLRQWRAESETIRTLASDATISLPMGGMEPIGYVIVQQPAKKGRTSDQTYRRRRDQISQAFHEHLVGDEAPVGTDPGCLGELRHLQGLLAIAREARKPVFDLKAADGAIGSYTVAVKDAYVAFEKLAREIANRVGIALPESD